jgi:hypothetical protein
MDEKWENYGPPRTQEKKPPNATKVGSQTHKKFLLCCFVAIGVQKWFVGF